MTLPTPGALEYEVGQTISLYVGDAREEFRDPDLMVPARILQMVDIGIRTGLVLDVPEGSALVGLTDEWMENLLDKH